jgi:hypothetical protein
VCARTQLARQRGYLLLGIEANVEPPDVAMILFSK